jgi:glycosyltransferase involved in cell wall biosynthesis
MRAAIHNPYLDTLGGGERYTMSVAKKLKGLGYCVDLEWKDRSIISKLELRFGFDLKGINVVPDIKRGDGYDVCFWVSDGSIPALKSRKNILHFQVPFHNKEGGSLLNKMKLFRINHVVCNSDFTKSFIDKEYGVKSIVIYPPVATEEIKPSRKQNLILFVGRFSRLKQAKNHDVVIEAFKKFYDMGNKNWKLTLAGGVEVGVGDYLDKLSKMSVGYPISFEKSPSHRHLLNLYGKAKYFWSAVGYEIDERKEPERVEHFGITLVEAMAAGCVVFAYNAGGHKEIVESGENGFLWNDTIELIAKSAEVVEKKTLSDKLSKNAIKKSKKFSTERFEEELEKLL